MNWDENLVFLPGRGDTNGDAQTARNQISVVEGREKNKGSCTVDLKLGGLGDFGGGFTHRKPPPPPAPSSTPPVIASPGATRRSRSCNNGHQVSACIVDDCSADLSGCKDYHKKHKVCEAHSKAVKVTVEGVEKRFCQQCSKFHALSEFDEVKRSCRKRLDGHNKRRRKSHPDLSASSSIANIQGSRFPSYMNQHNYPSVIREPGWTAGFFKSDEESVYNQQHHMMSVNRQHSFPVSSSSYHKDSNNKQFPFLQNGEIKLGNKSIETSVCQPLATTVSPLGSRSGMYSDGLISVIDSDCALSLLSSSTQSSGLSGLKTLNNIDEIHMALPLVQGMQFNNIDRFPSDKVLTSICCSTNDIMSSGFSCTGIVDDQGPILVANTGCAEFHSPEMLQPVGNVANLVNAAVHPLHFSWH